MNGTRRDLWLNAALLSQVVLTVVLTGLLWLLPFGRQTLPTERTNVTLVPSGGFVSVPALVRPVRFIAHWTDGHHAAAVYGTFEYDGLWEQVRPLIASGALLRLPDWQLDLGSAIDAIWGKAPAIDVELAGPLAIGDWAHQWGATLNDSLHDHTLIDRILVVLGPAPTLYFFGPSGIWRAPGLPPFQQEGLLSWMQRTPLTDLQELRLFKAPDGIEAEPGLFVPAQLPRLDPPQLQPNKTPPGDLEASIFPDLSVVREISEGNGAVIYTDGQKYLRLNPTGTVEYRAPELSGKAKAPALDQALDLAAQFVAEHGGWPQGLVLTAASQSGGQTALEFGRSAGRWPLVSKEPLLRVEVGSDRVTSFYRVAAFSEVLPPKAPGTQRALPPETVLANWRALYQRRPPPALRSVFFAYNYSKDALTPVWYLSFQGASSVQLDARTGQLLP